MYINVCRELDSCAVRMSVSNLLVRRVWSDGSAARRGTAGVRLPSACERIRTTGFRIRTFPAGIFLEHCISILNTNWFCFLFEHFIYYLLLKMDKLF